MERRVPSTWWFQGRRQWTCGAIGLLLLAAMLAACTSAPAPPKVEQPKAEQPKAQQAKPDQPKVESAKAEPTKAQAKPATLLPVTLAHSTVAASQAIIPAMKDAGIFAKHGLDVKIQYAAGATGIQALIAGETPIVYGSGAMSVLGRIGGADVVVIASLDNSMNYLLFTRKEIKTPSDLKGKKLAITRYGDASDFSTRLSLKRMGLNADDVTIIQIGTQPERFASMEAGVTDGGVLEPPFTVLARKRGFEVLHNLLDAPYVMGALVTSKAYIAKNEDTVRKMVTAWVEGIAFYKRNPDASRKALSSFLKLDDVDLIEEGYSHYAKKFIQVPHPTAEALQAILDELAVENPKAKEYKPSDLMETRFVKELEASGFIKKLYE